MAGDVEAALRADVERMGYYPSVVMDALATALGSEPVVDYVVQHEATFDHEELRRHITVLALTPTRLTVAHVDDFPADGHGAPPMATASTESVRLERVESVVLTRGVANPATHRAGDPPRDLTLTIGWGAVNRIELEPAVCPDPECEADHGLSGALSNDDLSLRVSTEADGQDVVQSVLDFAATLSRSIAGSLTTRITAH